MGNATPPATNRTYTQILRDNVLNFINIAIFILGAELVAVDRPMDALLSVGIICINIFVSVVQEVRAKRILDRVALLMRPMATVVRAGAERQVTPEEVVSGDVLHLNPGDQAIVDGILRFGAMPWTSRNCPGESDLISKKTQVTPSTPAVSA